MNLTLEDVALLKQLKAAGEGGRTIRAYNMRLALDRLAKGGYVVARPTGLDLVHYRITGRGPRRLFRPNAQRVSNRNPGQWET
jgi:hypothetical protein